MFEFVITMIASFFEKTDTIFLVYDYDKYITDAKRPEQRSRGVKMDEAYARKLAKDPTLKPLDPIDPNFIITKDGDFPINQLMNNRTQRQKIPNAIMKWIINSKDLVPVGKTIYFAGAYMTDEINDENFWKISKNPITMAMDVMCMNPLLPPMFIGEADLIIQWIIYIWIKIDPAIDSFVSLSTDSDFILLNLLHHPQWHSMGIRHYLLRTIPGSIFETPVEEVLRKQTNAEIRVKKEKLTAEGKLREASQIYEKRLPSHNILIDMAKMYREMSLDYNIYDMCIISMLIKCDFVKFIYGIGATSMIGALDRFIEDYPEERLLEWNEDEHLWVLNFERMITLIIYAIKIKVPSKFFKVNYEREEYEACVSIKKITKMFEEKDKKNVRIPPIPELEAMLMRAEWYFNYCMQTPLTGYQPCCLVITDDKPRFGFVRSENGLVYAYPHQKIEEDKIDKSI